MHRVGPQVQCHLKLPVCSYVQTVAGLSGFGGIKVPAYVDACDWRLYERRKRVCAERCLGEKNLLPIKLPVDEKSLAGKVDSGRKIPCQKS